MAKILSESLQEFNESLQPKEEINEGLAVAPGAQFREYFLKAGAAALNSNKKLQLDLMVAWAKKLKSLGYPKASKIKEAVGPEKWKKFENGLLPWMKKQVPSFKASLGGTVTSGKGGDYGKDDNQRAELIGKAVGMTAEEIKDLITK